MTHLDLFAGILGFTIGAERAGFKTLACSEKDAFCSSVIAHRRPALPNLGDITQLDGRALQGHVDIGLHYGHAHLDGLTGCAILNGERGRDRFKIALFRLWWMRFRCGCEVVVDDYTRCIVEHDSAHCVGSYEHNVEDHDEWALQGKMSE